MKSIIAGNWKMNASNNMIDSWFETFTFNAVEFEKNNVLNENDTPLVLICLPDIYLKYAIDKANESNQKMKNFKVFIGAEDVHYEEKGAFTGNTSPLFLKEISCFYALVGHSERREFHFETNNIVAKKAISALNSNITPIICVGEKLDIRESGKHLEFVAEQVLESVEGVDLERAIIAYEPVWAIGTGKVPTESQIEEMESYIKDILQKIKKIEINKIQVVYGGSVKSSNAHNILHLKSVNGVLVGGASMVGDEFFNIVKNAF